MITIADLVDKLIIVRLKHYHADTDEKKESTSEQVKLLLSSINNHIYDIVAGNIDVLEFPQNKVYKKAVTILGSPNDEMDVGKLINNLIEINKQMWDAQDKLYDFDTIPTSEKDGLLKRATALNIERSEYMDAINRWFAVAFQK